MLDFTELDTWLAGLAAVDGVTSAVTDPAELRTPGVWCQVPTFAVDTLAAEQYRIDLVLHLAVGDQDWRNARKKLATLFDAVYGHLGRPRGLTATFEQLGLPEGNAVPALRFPFTLRQVPDPAPVND